MLKGRVGFTLIEVVIAVTLLSVGVLALAGSSGLIARRLAESKQSAGAVFTGKSRSESAFAQQCGAVSVDVRQRVEYATPRGIRAHDFLTAVLCE
jgi:prepilin-type N-terminal cleavage/methylation domain-containing protein